ncbi:protein PFC0760c isoform X2 [Capsella rubella]|uniref:protein PFC0760c isoform X2 n=1 Tax=Capsella rubella TaxID=81985 RepID=UPI000CD53E94|nr:protein PFC0760c isoform X2 [Capsella rubella]
MEEQREESEFCNEPMEEEAGKGFGLSSETETLGGEDTNTVQVSDSGVSGVSGIEADPNNGDGNTDNLVSDQEHVKADDVEETEDNVDDDDDVVEVSGEETRDNVDNDVEVSGEETKDNVDVALTDATTDLEVERKGETAKSEVKSNHSESHESAGEGENVTYENNGDYENKAEESPKKSEMDDKNMEDDSKQGNEENVGSETGDAIVPEEFNQLSERETNEVIPGTVSEVNQNEENGEAMEIDNEAEEQVEDDVKDIPVAEADVNELEEMEISERKDNADAASDLTGTIVSTDLANPNSPSENADPGNIQDLKTDTRNISSKEDKKAADMTEEDALVGIENGSSGANSPAAAIYCSKEASDTILVSEENQENKDHDKETADQKDTMREEEDITHEAQSINPNQKEDTEMEEDPNSSTVTGTEAYKVEEMGDTYWTDRVIHNGGEEQTSPTEKGNYQVVPVELKPAQVQRTRRPYRRRQTQINIPLSVSGKPANFDENAPAELVMKFSEVDTIPPEKSLSKMFKRFGPIKESQTEVDKENKRARVVYRKGADAEVAYNSAGRFSIFGTKAVNYELSYTITETLNDRPNVVSSGEEDAALCLPS